MSFYLALSTVMYLLVMVGAGCSAMSADGDWVDYAGAVLSFVMFVWSFCLLAQ